MPISSFDVTKNTSIFNYTEEPIEINVDSFRTNFLKFCHSIASHQKLASNQILSLNNKEKHDVLKYIEKNFNVQYDELKFAFNIEKNVQEFKDFGAINSNKFNH